MDWRHTSTRKDTSCTDIILRINTHPPFTAACPKKQQYTSFNIASYHHFFWYVTSLIVKPTATSRDTLYIRCRIWSALPGQTSDPSDPVDHGKHSPPIISNQSGMLLAKTLPGAHTLR